MKVFAEFQKMSTGWNGVDFSGPAEVIPACGSDGVYILDGRNRLATWIEDARKRAKALEKVSPGIVGFKLYRGSRFSDAKPIGDGRMYPIEG